ncbi:MAG TPA: SDR family oxidoreductase [Stellaceae bacterium]|nr:SDR family oxidoreductase [Terriglobia bacterium]HEV2551773.1 SDR family oxidoreductase [Stellaceae bacterium]
MKILVLGATGMLGHQLVKNLSGKHQARGVSRAQFQAWEIDNAKLPFGEFDVVVNCIGIVKQRGTTPEEMIEVNALFPHRLARVCREANTRLIHLSTDCVFSGRRGNYSEQSTPDPDDLYGRSKLLGEVQDEGCLTIRTSIIGRELNRQQGLVEWLLRAPSPVRGFAKHIFTGITTIEAARIVDRIIAHYPDASGLWHVGADPIDKYALLGMLVRHYGLKTEVQYDSSTVCDRSLDSRMFRAAFSYKPPSWTSMIAELAKECPLAA